MDPVPGRDNMAYHNGRLFTTYDVDNDAHGSANCAQISHSEFGYGGAWWFSGCSRSVLTRPHPYVYWYAGETTIEMKVCQKQCIPC